MERTGVDVAAFVAGVKSAKRRRDAETLIAMMRDITGLEPEMWTGNIVGFGEYHWKYDSGREGSAGAVGFAPRTAATVVYLPDGIGRYDDELARLGPHKTGVGCLYLADLEQVDADVLRAIVADSFRRLTSDTYTQRAREGRADA
ncbi:MAG: DUF1801 domain-containing protein [Arachnia sp.]